MPAYLAAAADLAWALAQATAAAARDVLLRRVALRDAANWDYFWRRYIFGPRADCWDRAIAGAPAAHVLVAAADGAAPVDCVNLGSYNYLGWEAAGADELAALDSPSPPAPTLEHAIAQFVEKEAALVVGAGFATNAAVLPALIAGATPRVHVFSDALNHASIVTGLAAARRRGAVVRVVRHNDVGHLDEMLAALLPPERSAAWVVVEGIYSMEGDVCPLAAIVALRAKYGFRLYVDEAHSIGALGAHGRGICEHAGVDPADVDVRMGTFTKAFSACGGYVASDAATIAALRARLGDGAQDAAQAIGAVAVAHICSILARLQTPEGAARMARLHENARQMRGELRRLGYAVLGDDASPVVPMLTNGISHMCALSRRCLAVHRVALVVVGFPATSLTGSRARICVSAAHSSADIAHAVASIDEAARAAGIVAAQ